MNLIKPTTPKFPLYSRLGKVGSIQAYPLWESRRSIEHAQDAIANIGALAHGFELAKNPGQLFQFLFHVQHLSVFEFIPCIVDNSGALPARSVRHHLDMFKDPSLWGDRCVEIGNRLAPGAIFRVKAPIFVARQWMRHRAFAILEMSRRSTPTDRVPLEFYGQDDPEIEKTYRPFWDHVQDEFDRRRAAGIPLELCSRCMPVETMTEWWVGGFTENWLRQDPIHHEDFDEEVPGFCGLRSAPEAQAEIRAFSTWIESYLTGQIFHA